jgi:hypothetical protein
MAEVQVSLAGRQVSKAHMAGRVELRGMPLGTVLIHLGYCTPAQVNGALREPTLSLLLGEVLVKGGALSRVQLGEALRVQRGQ